MASNAMVIKSPLAPHGPPRGQSPTDNTESINNGSRRCPASDGSTNFGDSSRPNESTHNVKLHHQRHEHTQEHSGIHAEVLDQILTSIDSAFSRVSSPVERPLSGQSTISEISNSNPARGDSPLGAPVSPTSPYPQTPQQPTFNNPVTHAEASAPKTTQASVQLASLEAYTQAQKEQSEGEPQPHKQLFSEIEELHRHPYLHLLEPRVQYFRVCNKGFKATGHPNTGFEICTPADFRRQEVTVLGPFFPARDVTLRFSPWVLPEARKAHVYLTEEHRVKSMVEVWAENKIGPMGNALEGSFSITFTIPKGYEAYENYSIWRQEGMFSLHFQPDPNYRQTINKPYQNRCAPPSWYPLPGPSSMVRPQNQTDWPRKRQQQEWTRGDQQYCYKLPQNQLSFPETIRSQTVCGDLCCYNGQTKKSYPDISTTEAKTQQPQKSQWSQGQLHPIQSQVGNQGIITIPPYQHSQVCRQTSNSYNYQDPDQNYRQSAPVKRPASPQASESTTLLQENGSDHNGSTHRNLVATYKTSEVTKYFEEVRQRPERNVDQQRQQLRQQSRQQQYQETYELSHEKVSGKQGRGER